MTEVTDYVRSLDSHGQNREFSTSAVIKTSTIVKEMPANTLAGTLAYEHKKRDDVKVAPDENVGEDFMRETNQFVKI